MMLREYASDEGGGGGVNGVLNLLRNWTVALTWSSVRPMALRSNRFRYEVLRRWRALCRVRVTLEKAWPDLPQPGLLKAKQPS